MATRVVDVVERLLPGVDVKTAPPWPPDLFAIAATLITQSGCYSALEYTAGMTDDGYFNKAFRDEVCKLGKAWAQGTFPSEVQQLWTELIDPANEICDEKCAWWDTALKLLSISDEAATGFGFLNPKRADLPMAKEVFDDMRQQKRDYTLCRAVPETQACVQPKTRTPQVGCTVRSFSHNLSLLPPVTDVRTHWRYADVSPEAKDTLLNLLIIPYPYEIKPSCFRGRVVEHERGLKLGFFDIEQKWLTETNTNELERFVRALIDDAEQKEVEKVHGVVFPEGSLSLEYAQELAGRLRDTGLELFLSGILNPETLRSETYCTIFHRPSVSWQQSKHHRWKLDGRQLRTYGLAHVLGTEHIWWEHIDVSRRECFFHVFRGGASLAVLICEDLARIDPVQTVVRAIGPNLVIALLMDGAQFEGRWPGRYATVLADDPGSAVLTLTCLGLMRRCDPPVPRKIALWKDPMGVAEELELPADKHAFVLSIRTHPEENLASDWRSDNNMSLKLSLARKAPVGVDSANFPWLHA